GCHCSRHRWRRSQFLPARPCLRYPSCLAVHCFRSLFRTCSISAAFAPKPRRDRTSIDRSHRRTRFPGSGPRRPRIFFVGAVERSIVWPIQADAGYDEERSAVAEVVRLMAFSPTLSQLVLVITAAALFYAAVADLKEFKIRNELILVLVGLFVVHASLSGR